MKKNDTSPTHAQTGDDNLDTIKVEIFVQKSFAPLELSSIVTVLQAANKIRGETVFSWRFVSDHPGLLQGNGGMIIRAEPSIVDYGLADWMIIIGSEHCDPKAWLSRLRAMQRVNRPVALLSDAATAYIRGTQSSEHAATTHWRDIIVLKEAGYFPKLSTRLSETSKCITTSAGSGATIEFVLSSIAEHMTHYELAELGSQFLLETIRNGMSEQPKGVSYNSAMFDRNIGQAIHIMEQNLTEALPTHEIADEVGISLRHLERMFKLTLGVSPARFYKKLRLNKAREMIDGSKMGLIHIAMATGFASTSSLSSAYRKEFGCSPTEVRSAKRNPNQ
ncbi:GlxA family transcriptional regulator [Cochlodiniinecator piscidefendens]|uniref:GlxA family transcriptional regulator n=1 Tax=Cochlodiniinecator piscidefendens TaxID=2715756 RepID=UPI001407C49D|nr:helix-turn-helix domain-containing protein [Cochlodiniinecator piscidefendens]